MTEHDDAVTYPTRRAAREAREAALRAHATEQATTPSVDESAQREAPRMEAPQSASYGAETPQAVQHAPESEPAPMAEPAAVDESAVASTPVVAAEPGAPAVAAEPAAEESTETAAEQPSAEQPVADAAATDAKPRRAGLSAKRRGLLRWFLVGGAVLLAAVVVIALAVSFLGRGSYALGSRTSIGSLSAVPPKMDGWSTPVPTIAAISSSDGACQFSAGVATSPAGLSERPVVIEVGDEPRVPQNDGDATRAYLRMTIEGFTAGSPEWTIEELDSQWVEMRQGPEETAKTDRVELSVFRAKSANSVLYYAGHTFLGSGSSIAMTTRCNGADRMTEEEARKLFAGTTITYAEAPKA